MATNDFWSGLLNTGAGLFASSQEMKAREDALRKAQSPLYDQATALAGSQLSLAGGFDPSKAAAEQYGKYRDVTAAGKEQDQNALMRKLHAKGLLGVASFDPVAGTKATPGVAMNPHMAALYASQAGADQKAAFDALEAGDRRLTNIVSRAANTAGIGQDSRASNLNAMIATRTGVKPSIGGQIVGALLKDPKMLSSGVGMLGSGLDWLKNQFGGGGGSPAAGGWGGFGNMGGVDWSASYDDYSPGGFSLFDSNNWGIM